MKRKCECVTKRTIISAFASKQGKEKETTLYFIKHYNKQKPQRNISWLLNARVGNNHGYRAVWRATIKWLSLIHILNIINHQ